ncbi:MAG: hypothetical protein GY779_13070 [Gammaproteobacteria bacterium]|nr:hypothetical protein [Gammaproteobacteria bacterium]
MKNLNWIIQNEVAIRLSFFFGAFTVTSIWKINSPRRVLTISKSVRWLNNPGLVFIKSIVLRLLFSAAAVGVVAVAGQSGWGGLNFDEIPFIVSVFIAVIGMDFIIYLQHLMVRAKPLLWRFHRVHHSLEDNEANSNFGFSLPWWDRFFGTYRDHSRGGHEVMVIGKVSGYAINRREWSNQR